MHLGSIVIKYPELSLIWTDQDTVKNWLSLFSSMQSNCMLCYESLAGLVVGVNSHIQFYMALSPVPVLMWLLTGLIWV